MGADEPFLVKTTAEGFFGNLTINILEVTRVELLILY